MANGIQCSAIWKSERKTLSINGWAKLTDKSTTFLRGMMAEAERKGIKGNSKQMQYAIQQVPGHRVVRQPSRRDRVEPNTDQEKIRAQDRFRKAMAVHFQNFLYSGSVHRSL